MRITKLHEKWVMRECGDTSFIPAAVPGSVYTDLLNAGRMDDPFYRDNEYQALEVMEKDYEYETHFEVSGEWMKCDEVLLRFLGIDTLSTITLNGSVLGKTENMHRIWEYSVKERLHEGDNKLHIVLHSPTKFIEASYKKEPINGCVDAMRGLPRLRKAHSMFGWDWGPRIPDAGIWRDVELVGIDTTRFDSVYITQKHERNVVILGLEVETEKKADTMYQVTVSAPDGSSCVYPDSPKNITIEDPCIWWPNGYGEQPLYGLKIDLYMDGRLLDTWEKKIGLRTMTVVREKDEYGESFAHEVNGIRIFGMGADYIPEDNLLSRVTPERTRNLLLQCRNAHFNVIRVWGGGYYPDDFFFDACDELGLIVWQDFMFACCVYDLTEEFEETITAEFIDNIKRIRHHASLGLWCGNNEMEYFIEGDPKGWCWNPIQQSDYVKMFEYIIPKLLRNYDPQTFYWPASPSSGGGFDAPNDENRGDVHYWEVWHGGKPFTEYRKFFFRYVSEFGFQSFPGLKTVETFTEPEDRNIFSYVMEKHQRNASANGNIMKYMEQTYLYPNDFETTLYASQLLQAEAMRYGVEHFRRNRGRCMGTIIWQLNDIWPSASWSSIDYYGRWKALHYYAKRFFAPLLLSCQEESTLSQDPNVNAQPYELKKSITLCVSNETLSEKTVTVRWALRNNGSEIIKRGEEVLKVSPLSSQWLDQVDMAEADIYTNYASYEMEEDGTIVSAGTVLFCAPKYFRFQNPHLQVETQGDVLLVTASAYAGSVEILNGNDDMLLEDNYFDMNAGTRSVKIVKGRPENLKLRSVYDIR